LQKENREQRIFYNGEITIKIEDIIRLISKQNVSSIGYKRTYTIQKYHPRSFSFIPFEKKKEEEDG
jgi:hypothetical protein